MKTFILLMIFISTTYAALNGNCTEASDCSVTSDMRCQEGKCVCDTPWFAPCNSSFCIAQRGISYEGDQCRSSENCLINAVCDTTGKQCRCENGFTSSEGLCYKSLNSSCQNSDECWPRECRENHCQCPVGYKAKDGNRCKLNLAQTYANWTLAGQTNDFCYNDFSCLDSSAICRDDSIHTEKFCQCPPTHRRNQEKQICEWKEYDGLSPLISPSSNDTCGRCKVPNAICAHVSDQTTCWCRASFEAGNGTTCNKKYLQRIFPSHGDVSAHDYSTNCSRYDNGTAIRNENGLCVCAPGYEFANGDASCQPIKPRWINEKLEYGVCTKINSRGEPVQEDGLCPKSLTCQARGDKYVCSCGHDKFYDEESTNCYSYLNRVVTDGTTCPPSDTVFKDSQCQCNPADVYLPADNKRCELKLDPSADSEDSICNSTALGTIECAKYFYGYAKFCKQGECRCMSKNSFYAANKCITLLHSPTTNNSVCPEHANIMDGVCQCNAGYRANSTNTTCVKLPISLQNSTNPSKQDLNENITSEDCRALFPQQYVSVSNNVCTCQAGTISNGSICIFQLNYLFPADARIEQNCPEFASNHSNACQCEPGYKTVDNHTCVVEQQQVHEYNSTANCTQANLTDTICKKLFGNAAERNERSNCCTCQQSDAAFRHENRCYFRLDVKQKQAVQAADCPPNSRNENQICVCRKYYPTSKDQKTCATEPNISFTAQAIDPRSYRWNSSCQASDCQSLYGPGTICHENICYCDRTKSFVRDGTCKLYTGYVFPGGHERYAYACESNTDCGSDAEKNGIECDFHLHDDYKVCQCRKGFYLNPEESKCMNNLCEPCGANEECQGHECVCKKDFYRDASNKCVPLNMPLKLYEQCNRTLWGTLGTVIKQFQCSLDCGHLKCASGYHDKTDQCVAYEFGDHCAHEPGLCSGLSPGASCSFDENKCACVPGYYRSEKQTICVKTIGSSCTTSQECGQLGSCENRQCRCVSNSKEIEEQDFYGREIKICVEKSNVDQFKSHPILILILLFIHLVFA